MFNKFLVALRSRGSDALQIELNRFEKGKRRMCRSQFYYLQQNNNNCISVKPKNSSFF